MLYHIALFCSKVSLLVIFQCTSNMKYVSHKTKLWKGKHFSKWKIFEDIFPNAKYIRERNNPVNKKGPPQVNPLYSESLDALDTSQCTPKPVSRVLLSWVLGSIHFGKKVQKMEFASNLWFIWFCPCFCPCLQCRGTALCVGVIFGSRSVDVLKN